MVTIKEGQNREIANGIQELILARRWKLRIVASAKIVFEV